MKNLIPRLLCLTVVLWANSATSFGQASAAKKTRDLKTLINQYAANTIRTLNAQDAKYGGFKYSVSDKNIFNADMNGDGEFDAVVEIFFCETGNCHPTTKFSELVVFLNKNGKYQFVASKGFRLYGKINSIADGVIRIDVYDLDEGDPQCCPELKRIEFYSLRGNRLTKVRK